MPYGWHRSFTHGLGDHIYYPYVENFPFFLAIPASEFQRMRLYLMFVSAACVLFRLLFPLISTACQGANFGPM